MINKLLFIQKHREHIFLCNLNINNRKVRGVVTPLGTAIKIALWTNSPQPKEVSSLYTFHIS